MSTAPNGYRDPEDMFAHTRMSLGDHIEELRRHMIKALLGFGVAMIIGLFISKSVLDYISRPVVDELTTIHERRVAQKQQEYRQKQQDGTGRLVLRPASIILEDTPTARALGAEPLSEQELKYAPRLSDLQGKPLSPEEWEAEQKRHERKSMGLWKWVLGGDAEPEVKPEDRAKVVRLHVMLDAQETAIVTAGGEDTLRPPSLQSLTATETFIVWMKVSVYCGIVLSSPWIFYQMWAFVAAGLYPHEKKYVHIYLPFSLALFLCGVLVCQYLVMPIGIHYLLSFNEWMNVEPNLRLTDWLSFAIMMPLITGAAFQTPLVMFFLERAGIVTVEQYQKHWRIAIFGLTLAGALLAASPDPLSMLSLAVPMCCLYWLGILLCKYMPRHKDLDLDVPESEELIEV